MDHPGDGVAYQGVRARGVRRRDQQRERDERPRAKHVEGVKRHRLGEGELRVLVVFRGVGSAKHRRVDTGRAVDGRRRRRAAHQRRQGSRRRARVVALIAGVVERRARVAFRFRYQPTYPISPRCVLAVHFYFDTCCAQVRVHLRIYILCVHMKERTLVRTKHSYASLHRKGTRRFEYLRNITSGLRR
eukprot:1196358-Prorocentrum_minimum.AAC.4